MKIAYCGLDCEECDAYIATQENSDNKRAKVAGNWSKMFGGNITPEEINCNGCQSDKLFSHCKVCDIRKCGIEKELDNCGLCADYTSCDKLLEIHKHDQNAKKRLDNVSR